MTKNTVPLTNYEVLKVLSARERPMNETTKEFLDYLKKLNNTKTIERSNSVAQDTDYELKIQNANLDRNA